MAKQPKIVRECLCARMDRDLALLQAIAGVDNPKDGSITIVEDYFANCRMIDRREHGYEVPEDYQPTTRCDYEITSYRSDKMMEEAEQARHPLIKEWDSSLSDPDWDTSDYIAPKPRMRVIVV